MSNDRQPDPPTTNWHLMPEGYRSAAEIQRSLGSMDGATEALQDALGGKPSLVNPILLQYRPGAAGRFLNPIRVKLSPRVVLSAINREIAAAETAKTASDQAAANIVKIAGENPDGLANYLSNRASVRTELSSRLDALQIKDAVVAQVPQLAAALSPQPSGPLDA